jgi:LPXTG-motif cell wall-anchored protein
MGRSRLLALLAVACALLLPAAALADSAGDNQYSDPFGNSQPTQSQTAPATPAPSQPATSSQPQATAAPVATSTDPSGQLPRTGIDLRLVGGAGLVLLGSGLLLRRRLSRS